MVPALRERDGAFIPGIYFGRKGDSEKVAQGRRVRLEAGCS